MFSSKTVPEGAQAPENWGKVWNMPGPPWKEIQIKESLNKLYIHKLMEHKRLDPQGQRKLHDATAILLFIIFELLWSLV